MKRKGKELGLGFWVRWMKVEEDGSVVFLHALST